MLVVLGLFNQLILMYVIFLLLGTIIQYRLWKKEKLTALFIFHATFLGYYFAVPLMVFVFHSSLDLRLIKFPNYILNSSFEAYYTAFAITIFAYLTILCCFFIRYEYININKLGKKKFVNNNFFPKQIIYRFGLFFFIVGGGSLVIFFNILGGFREAISLADTLRNTEIDPSEFYGPFAAIFRTLSPLVMGSAYCFKVCADNTNSKKLYVLFLVSFVLSMAFLVFNSGRGTIIFFLLPFIIAYLIKKNKNIVLPMLIIFTLAVVTAEVFDVILYQMSYGAVDLVQTNISILSNIISALNDLSFPYANMLMVNNMNELHGFRYGADYFVWIINLLPSRALDVIGISIPQLESLNQNTSLYHYLLDPTASGGVPTDFITFGMRQLSLAGLAINTVLYCFLAIYFDKLSHGIGMKDNVIIIRLQLFFFTFIVNNDLTDIIRGSLFALIMLFMLILVKRRKKRAIMHYEKLVTQNTT